ncbi:translation initiation factor IF-2-like [Zalophus californianus]|uniref:Translation initiation factor IF-2-like n=1 Tax=Zalophus californianus TaxID=9704 RepID=A0A6J2DIT7_ZALCA|nr:translation initiation factor IF-2-like [Zalophus californianus]
MSVHDSHQRSRVRCSPDEPSHGGYFAGRPRPTPEQGISIPPPPELSASNQSSPRPSPLSEPKFINSSVRQQTSFCWKPARSRRRGPGTRTPERKEGAPAAAPHLPRSARPRRRLAPRPQPPRPPEQRAHTALGQIQRSRARGRGPAEGAERGRRGRVAGGGENSKCYNFLPCPAPGRGGRGTRRGEGSARRSANEFTFFFSPALSPSPFPPAPLSLQLGRRGRAGVFGSRRESRRTVAAREEEEEEEKIAGEPNRRASWTGLRSFIILDSSAPPLVKMTGWAFQVSGVTRRGRSGKTLPGRWISRQKGVIKDFHSR